jgi:acyl phosphate:glycerol-3-phosphate acyltransferase
MRWILVALGAFFLGSLPWGLWLGRFLRGVDVRRHGSGNLGAANVYRVLGPRLGIAVLLLDAGKGVAAVLVAHCIHHAGVTVGAGGPAAAGSQAVDWSGLLALAAAVLGHSFTPFAGFRGGKGVATAAGAWGVVAPLPLAVALGVWVVAFAIRRIVSLASIIAVTALPIAVWLLRPRPWADPVAWLSVVTGVLVVVRHRSNLSRLAAGSERSLELAGPRRADGATGKGGR